MCGGSWDDVSEDSDELSIRGSNHTLVKYSTVDRQWSVVIPFKSLLEDPAEILDAVFDPKSNLLYILAKQVLPHQSEKHEHTVLTMDITSKEVKRLTELSWECSSFKTRGLRMLVIGDHLHILEGCVLEMWYHIVDNGPPRYWVLDKMAGKLVSEQTMPVDEEMANLMYSKMRNSIIVWKTPGRWPILHFHSCTHRCGASCGDEIHEFSLQTNTWRRLQWCTTPVLYGTMCITEDGRYLLATGRAMSPLSDSSDKIVVIDLKNETCRVSKGRCQRKVRCSTITMESGRRNELLADGFIKRLFKTPPFCNAQLIPSDLIRLVANHLSNESIYLIGQDKGIAHAPFQQRSFLLDDLLHTEDQQL